MLMIYKPMCVFCVRVRLFKRLWRVEQLIAYMIVRLLRVSYLCARRDLCVQRTDFSVSDLFRMIEYNFARKRLMRSMRLMRKMYRFCA